VALVLESGRTIRDVGLELLIPAASWSCGRVGNPHSEERPMVWSYMIRHPGAMPASKQWLAKEFPNRREPVVDLRHRIERTPTSIAAYPPDPGSSALR
jgi:hypothetical protein